MEGGGGRRKKERRESTKSRNLFYTTQSTGSNENVHGPVFLPRTFEAAAVFFLQVCSECSDAALNPWFNTLYFLGHHKVNPLNPCVKCEMTLEFLSKFPSHCRQTVDTLKTRFPRLSCCAQWRIALLVARMWESISSPMYINSAIRKRLAW